MIVTEGWRCHDGRLGSVTGGSGRVKTRQVTVTEYLDTPLTPDRSTYFGPLNAVRSKSFTRCCPMHNAGRIDTKILVVYLGVFEAFKLLNKAVVRVDKRNDHWKTSFNEAFFASTAECGVRTIYFDSGIRSTIKVDLWAALSFGFAEPTTGGHRNISGVLFELDGNYVFKQLLEVSFYSTECIGLEIGRISDFYKKKT